MYKHWPRWLIRSFAVGIVIQIILSVPLSAVAVVSFQDYDEVLSSELFETIEDMACHETMASEQEITHEVEDGFLDPEVSLFYQDVHQSGTNENIEEPIDETGTWGTIPWEYIVDTQTIILYGGVAGDTSEAPWFQYKEFIKRIDVADKVILNKNSDLLFYYLPSLIAIDNSHNLDFSNVKTMNQMFMGTSQLSELDVSSWDVSNVNTMLYSFAGTTSLSTLDVSEWNTSNLTTVTRMFIESGITRLDLSSWRLNNTDVTGMFTRANELKTLILGENSILSESMSLPMIQQENYTGRWIRRKDNQVLDYSNVFENSETFAREYTGEFPGTYTWEPVLSLWGTVPWEYKKDTQTIILYEGEGGTVGTAPWKTHNTVREIMVVQSVILPVNSSSLFSGLNNLESIEYAENLDVSNVENMHNMFGATRTIKFLDVSQWDTSNVKNMSFMFNHANSLDTLDVSNWDTSQVIDMQAMFNYANSLTTLDVSNWDTSQVIYMQSMFSNANFLTTLDVKNWDTSQVIYMQAMFQNANALKKIDVSNWDTSQVTNMAFMFTHASDLEEIDVSNWNTSSLLSTQTMFNNVNLEEIDVSNWDTSQVTNMRMMFQNANALKKIDVSNWDTSQVIDMAFMFTNASDLEEIDVSNWDTSQVTNMQSMFGNTNALNRITLGEQSIFSAATNLPAIASTEQYTGRWTLEENLSGDGSVITFENSTEFMANYDGSSPGTYIWERVAPEQLVASIDRVSDQSQTISGYATESVDELTISYQTTSGDKVVLEKDDPRIVWGDYQESNQQVRQFQIDLIGNERLETETKVTITVSKPSVETTGDKTEEQTVIKGINYRANNLTLDRFKINELSTQEELDALILQESRAQAANVLTEADMTDDFRIVETDLTREVDEDGSYFAVLEVGNKAYQMTIGIDVTSKLEHMRVTVPTKMVFESLYNTAESNRNFESQAYEIRNQSPLAVDTYINQLAIDDPAGIVLLEEGEDPLDYAESEEEDPTLTYDDISTPLLRLNLKTEETQIQLYETMEEQHLIRLEERSRVPISLTGDFYGDYPQWVVDSEADQGGYYEDLLVPNYRIVLRFVPRD